MSARVPGPLNSFHSDSLSIDSVRGLACLLLVGWHVFGDGAHDGLHIGDGTLRNFADAMSLIRMPLFTFLSGMVYAHRPYSGDLRDFIGGKVRRLLFPLLTIGTAFAVIHTLVGHHSLASINWLTLQMLPIGQYWFIQSLFLVFLAIALLESLKLLDTLPGVIFGILIALSISNLDIDVHEFGIHGLFYLTPFFLLGLGYQRFSLGERIGHAGSTVMLCGLLVALVAFTMGLRELPDPGSWLNSGIGLIGCIGLMSLGLRSRFLRGIGVYSYSVYLLHVFFTSPMRSLAEKAGVSWLPILFLVGLTAGVVGPMLLDRLLSRYQLTATLLLGKSSGTRAALAAKARDPQFG